MNADIDLKEIEKKAWTSAHGDGLLDIAFALLFANAAFSQILVDIGLPRPMNFLLFPSIAVLAVVLGKRFVTTPRIGYVEFSPRRKAIKSRLRWFVLGGLAVLSILALLIFTRVIDPERQYLLGSYWVPLALGGIIILMLSVIAYCIDFPRLYAYSLIWGLGLPLTEFLEQYVGSPMDALIVFGIPAGIALIIGLVLLVGFMRKYSLQSDVNNEFNESDRD